MIKWRGKMFVDTWMKMEDGVDLYVRKWVKQDTEPVAIIQLAHGMIEHINRYNEFADFLVSNRIFVYGNDHRGHGKTGEQQGLFGYFAEENGFEKAADDLFQITKQIKIDYPHAPVFLFGHSMGSFLARRYIQKHSSVIAGLILSGTGYYPSMTVKAGQTIAGMLPPKEQSKLMNYLTLGSNNKGIKERKSKFDWLTRDDQVIQDFIEDPYTGFIPTAGFFYDLMSGLTDIHNQKFNLRIRPDLPIFLISGDADPIGMNGKGVFKTAHLLEEAGIQDVVTMLFENGRHELLNEVNREEVFNTVLYWINNHIHA